MMNIFMSMVWFAVMIFVSLATGPACIVYFFLGSILLPKDRDRSLSEILFQILIWPAIMLTSQPITKNKGE